MVSEARVQQVFDRMERLFRRSSGRKTPVLLHLSDWDCYDAQHGRACEERSFAWCRPSLGEIFLAKRALRLPMANILGLLLHEFGHAYDPYWHAAESERRADMVAESLLGIRIYYDHRDIQTVSHGRRPRPSYLPR